MTDKAKWPITAREQDNIAIHAFTTILEMMVGAKSEGTRITYTRPFASNEGGSMEISMLCDILGNDALNRLTDLVTPVMLDGSPSVDVDIHFIWNSARRKELAAEWKKYARGEKATLFVEYFEVNITLGFTPNDWNAMARARDPKPKPAAE